MSLALLCLAGCADKSGLPRELAGADAMRGQATADRLACAACHEIPGIPWPEGRTGGTLAGFASRPMIAGRMPNQPETLVRWLRNAPALDATTGMPPIAMSVSEARDVAAYLYTLQ